MNATTPTISQKQIDPAPSHAAATAQLFARVYGRLGFRGTPPAFEVTYRPFASLRSSIAFRNGDARVRISDVLARAPQVVIEALAEILLTRVHRRTPSIEARECYLAYVSMPAIRRRMHRARRARSRVRLLPPRGRFYDLEKIAECVNRHYFGGRLRAARIGWSAKPLRSVYGHYDPSHRIVTISRGLDSAAVPARVVEYMVFHEMLHMRYPIERRGARRVIHSRRFREAEKKFLDFQAIRKELRHLPD